MESRTAPTDGAAPIVGASDRAIEADRGARGAEVGVGLLQRLVGRIDLLFERVELRVVEKRPPVALQVLRRSAARASSHLRT